ncbi:MAG: spore photoproduct lyase family protein [Candidatus Omnitrophota bacterium]|jgi:spore photoproduct lyase
MLDNLKNKLETIFNFRLNKNQWHDIERLFFEIIRRENITAGTIIEDIKTSSNLQKHGGRNKFFALKNALIHRRFPLTCAKQEIDTKNIFLNRLKEPLKDSFKGNRKFKPLEIFVEKEVNSSYIVENFRRSFPDVPIREVDLYNEYLKTNKFNISDLKKPIVFIIKEKWDFLKACPCTKQHISCGYWILNLGFGCPFDCSYCFLQCYANFPGIVLPANITDFFTQFDSMYKNLKKPIRIGTGEFCDSLALDDITEYSTRLIPYLRDKNISFELKTKSNNIANLLKIKSSKNIIISWSLNPPSIVENEELLTANLNARLDAARAVQEKGYSVAFHFDPIIYSEAWKELYKDVIDELYKKTKAPFAWISLGTLRSHRSLKNINELRFPQSNIFYGELLLGEDKKLRYPEYLRKEIYSYMVKSIREHDSKTPLYFCMENKDIWSILDKKSTMDVETSLLGITANND